MIQHDTVQRKEKERQTEKKEIRRQNNRMDRFKLSEALRKAENR